MVQESDFVFVFLFVVVSKPWKECWESSKLPK